MRKPNYRLDLVDERLWRGDQPVQISNKAFQLLRLFVGNPNRLLTKDHILDAVWQDVWVSEGLIKEYVHDLRQALEDDPKQPKYIETVHGRGYRFLGGIEEATRVDGVAALSRSRTRPPSLAVVPFVDLTEDERWARFCHGLSDDLVIDLARYPEFVVVSDNTTPHHSKSDFESRQTTHAFNTDYVLSGSIQVSDRKVRVNVKLIDTHNGTLLWTDRYERDGGEFFSIQSDIVAHVASAIGGFSGQIPHVERQRLGRASPGDLQAYELYLLSHEFESHFQKQSTLRAFDLAQRAIKLDPSYARAWLVLGWSCWQIVLEQWVDDIGHYSRLWHDAFLKAAELDPLDPFAMAEMAAVRAYDGDNSGARDALERALDLGGNQADLLIMIANPIALQLDEPERAMQIMKRGLDLIVRVGDWQRLSMARVAYFVGDFDNAVEDARRGPDNLLTQLVEILSLAQLGRTEEAQERTRGFLDKHPGFDAQGFASSYPITAAGAKQLFFEGIDKAGLR